MAIESVLHESRVFPPPKEFAAKARLGSMQAYQAMCKEAETNYAEFWAKQAREEIIWKSRSRAPSMRVRRRFTSGSMMARSMFLTTVLIGTSKPAMEIALR